MAVKITQNFIDHSREQSRTQWHVAEGLDDDYTDSIADANTVQAGIAAVTLCNFGNMSLSKVIEADVAVTPSDEMAQRELALWVQYQDVTTGKYQSMSIPGPDLSLLAQANTDEVDIVANVAALALLAIINANVVSDVGNDVAVTRMRIIGRRS